MLGILSFSHMITWILGFVALAFGVLNHDIFFLQQLGVIVGVRWIVQWLLFFIINRKLDKTVEWFTFPLMDFAFFIYYIFFGLFVMTRRKPRTTWN
jgi:hypothetical protein